MANMLLRKNGEIAPERMKRLGQSRNTVQLWMCLVVKVQCHKEPGRFSKLDVVRQEMTRLNIDILVISELKWTEMGKFDSDDHYIYYYGQEFLRRNGVAFIVNKSLKLSTWMQYQEQ